MFGIGLTELVIIAIFALLFVGPKKLPEVASQFGKFFVKFRRATTEARQTVDKFMKEAEREVILEEREKISQALSGSSQIDSPEESNQSQQ